jgi:hypothetical protein
VPSQSWSSALAHIPSEDLEAMIAILKKHELGGMATRQLSPVVDR